MAPPSEHSPEVDSPEDESPDRDWRWLQTLSEPELDFMMSLKELAVTQAANHPDLSHRFHLRALRALGIVLLEHFKGRLEQTSGGNSIERLALLRDDDPEVQSMSNGVDNKPKSGEEGAPGSKKRKLEPKIKGNTGVEAHRTDS